MREDDSTEKTSVGSSRNKRMVGIRREGMLDDGRSLGQALGVTID